MRNGESKAKKEVERAMNALSERINLGGEMMTRGAAYARLSAIAEAQGHNKKTAQLLAGLWMQGKDSTARPLQDR